MAAMDPHTQERVYKSLKEEYRAGLLEPGKRLDLQDLADRHRASKTPLREAACRLVGERLFERHSEGGFAVATLSAGGAQSLLECRLALTNGIFALLEAPTIAEVAAAVLTKPRSRTPLEIVSEVADFFVQIASCTLNGEIVEAVRNVDDRLLYLQLAEAKVSPNLRCDFYAFMSDLRGEAGSGADAKNVSFHKGRVQAAYRALGFEQ